MRSSTVSVANQTTNAIEVLVARLHESHEVSVYEAIERLVQAAGEVGLDDHTLLRMLDQGMTFEGLLELIESQMECSQSGVQPPPEGKAA
jgi:hypothetical protein